MQRLASAWCASLSGSQPSGCSVLWETDRKRPFLFGSLCSLSARRTATGWKMSRLRVSDGVFSLRRREEEGGGGVEEEEWW